MLPHDVDGQLQVTAGDSLLRASRLVHWVNDRYAPVSRAAFETYWRQDVDPVFGRLICWSLFSSGDLPPIAVPVVG